LERVVHVIEKFEWLQTRETFREGGARVRTSRGGRKEEGDDHTQKEGEKGGGRKRNIDFQTEKKRRDTFRTNYTPKEQEPETQFLHRTCKKKEQSKSQQENPPKICKERPVRFPLLSKEGSMVTFIARPSVRYE